MNAVTVQEEVSIFERLLVSPDAAKAVLSIHFPPDDEKRMLELMEKSNQGTLDPDEQNLIEAYRRIGSFLAILQAKARLQLQKGNGNGHGAA